MKKFNIPNYYRSSFIGEIKKARRVSDPRKKDFTPTTLNFGGLEVLVARHFGFCYGVENAIEISYKTLEENKGKRVFLLSQMIHNPAVNADLESKGIEFIMDTEGNHFMEFDELKSDDVVIIPAFGTTVEIEGILKAKGIQIEQYNTTCPFVERVWTASSKLGKNNSSVIIHGKPSHEETRATFSHAKEEAPSVVVKDMEEAVILGEIISGVRPITEFEDSFRHRASENFDPSRDFDKVGVINQTTMLAEETHAIAEHFKKVMIAKHGEEKLKEHFTDTRDTLCYATNDNQQATYALLEEPADFAIVVGGYNSSNTSHLVELCEEKLDTYFISGPEEIKEDGSIHHYNWRTGEHLITEAFLPVRRPLKMILTSGASCPDTVVDAVLDRIFDFVEVKRSREEVLLELA
ncbi:MAG TPA: 4-hydroxy-3-methylbut-2-enyl diphosphate reductase [Flavobacteriales bacterium]|nr:4-hydroxy-3-methylbut-2-enyl diphosphate reductase [Flavobacteriales bacterium]